MRAPRKRGFTLIELILTIVVIALGLTGLMSLFENVTRGIMEADNAVIAGNLAREKLEQIVQHKWNSGYAALDGALYPPETFTGDFSRFTRSTSIREVAGSDLSTAQEGSGYKRVEVTVSWGARATQTISLPTVLASY